MTKQDLYHLNQWLAKNKQLTKLGKEDETIEYRYVVKSADIYEFFLTLVKE